MRVELPVVGFISAFLVLVPLPLHWKAGNVCVLSAIFWLAACNITYGINAIIWRDSVTVRYEVWCDIATRVKVGAHIGLPASGMCICRRMAHVSSPSYKTPSSKDRKRRKRFEIGMCLLLPISVVALEVVVEARRFAIQEMFGCTPWLRYSIPFLLINGFSPVLLSLTEMLYAGVALRRLIHRRAQFQQASRDTQPTPASGPYLRLFFFAVAEMVFAMVVSIVVMVQNFQIGTIARTPWEDVHKDWLEIPQLPLNSMPEIYWMHQMFAWYIPPLSSLMLFGYFGLDDRVIAKYKYWFARIKPHIFRIESVRAPALPQSASEAIPAHGLAAVSNATDSPAREATSLV